VTGPTGTMDCHEARLSLGVLVLGVIDPEERPALEAHLTTCERCSAELAELAVLPGLLHRLDPVAAASGLPVPSPRFQDRVVAAGRVARARRRCRLVAALGTAAAVIAAALLAPALVRGDEPASNPVAGRSIVVDRTDPRTAVHARVSLAPEDSGTQLTLVLGGVRPGEHCRLVARDFAGRHETAASWVATYTGSASVTGTTSFPRRSITSLQVVRGDGLVLVSLPVPGARAG
jgi:hypothetical protein